MVASLIYSAARLLVELLSTFGAGEAALRAEVLALRRQVQVLERQIQRAHWTPGDRMYLAALRQHLPRRAWSGLLVQPATVLGWHRDLVRRRWAAYRGRPSRGRPQIAPEIRELILSMARDNPSWGYVRIRGELLKLGYRVSAGTIRSLLLRRRIPPAGRRSSLTWKRFLAAHAETLVAADFFTVDTVFFRRRHVLIFLHVANRRILSATCTREPIREWVTQQARNLIWRLDDDGLQLTGLIRDRDRKFPPSFDAVLEAEGVRVIRTPARAPTANAYAERWIGSCRRECLDWLLIASERQLQVVIDTYARHYNQQRPHRSCELRPPASRGDPAPIASGAVERRSRLGGLLNEYVRQAA